MIQFDKHIFQMALKHLDQGTSDLRLGKEMPKPTKGAIWLALEAMKVLPFFGRKKGKTWLNLTDFGN